MSPILFAVLWLTAAAACAGWWPWHFNQWIAEGAALAGLLLVLLAWAPILDARTAPRSSAVRFTEVSP